jgi:hypothetical protein
MRKFAFQTLFLSISLLCLISGVFGQWVLKQTTAMKITEPVVIDGVLEEDSWRNAPEVGGFIQFQPRRGDPAQFQTIVKLAYDEHFIYFGFLCYDPQPENIAARLGKRDADLRSDDSIYVLLDTFNDKQSCYYFGSNLLGTQWDGRISDNGRTSDDTWDGIWKSAAQKTDFGWSAELAIALTSVKYEPGEDKTWGLSLGRGVPRILEYSFWTGPLEATEKVSQFGELTELELAAVIKKSQIIPHVIFKVEEARSSEFAAGLDARYAFSQLVSGNLTINPDFATVEADQEQINLTRFELSLAEKRNFFLEGSEIYQQRIRLFYSRRIADIDGGLKVYGKSGGYEYQGLTTQAKKDESIDLDSANYTVFRLKRDVMTSSTIGFLAANKLIHGKNKGTAGVDTALYFTDRFQFTGQFALSYGDYDTDLAFFLRPSYDSATFHFHLRYTQLGRTFGDNANEVGYIRDDNRHEFDSALTKTFWVKKGIFDRINYESNYNIYWGMDKTLRSWQVDQELGFDFQNKLSIETEYHLEYKLYEKEFWNNQTEFKLGYNTREWQSASISYSFGRNFDLDFQLVEGSFHYKLTEDFSLSYQLTRLFYNPDPENESTWIHVVRSDYYFTKDLFIKLFYQVNTSIDKQNIQVVFIYRFQPPFGFVQLAYQKGTGEFGEKGIQGHTLFFKVTYVF